MNIFNFAEKGAVEMGDAALTGQLMWCTPR